MEDKTDFISDKELQMLFQNNMNNFVLEQKKENKSMLEFAKQTEELCKVMTNQLISLNQKYMELKRTTIRLYLFLIITLCLLLWSLFV